MAVVKALTKKVTDALGNTDGKNLRVALKEVGDMETFVRLKLKHPDLVNIINHGHRDLNQVKIIIIHKNITT